MNLPPLASPEEKNVSNCPYYFPRIDRPFAEQFLRELSEQLGNPPTFLFRDSSQPGQFVLTVYFMGQYQHNLLTDTQFGAWREILRANNLDGTGYALRWITEQIFSSGCVPATNTLCLSTHPKPSDRSTYGTLPPPSSSAPAPIAYVHVSKETFTTSLTPFEQAFIAYRLRTTQKRIPNLLLRIADAEQGNLTPALVDAVANMTGIAEVHCPVQSNFSLALIERLKLRNPNLKVDFRSEKEKEDAIADMVAQQMYSNALPPRTQIPPQQAPPSPGTKYGQFL